MLCLDLSNQAQKIESANYIISLYGLGQSPRMWFERIASYLKSIGMIRITQVTMPHRPKWWENNPCCVRRQFICGRGRWTKNQMVEATASPKVGPHRPWTHHKTPNLGVEFKKTPQGLLFLTQHQHAMDMLKGVWHGRLQNWACSSTSWSN